MENVKAIIPAADYLFIGRFISNEETRYYLGGVAIQPTIANGDGARYEGAMLIATDGHKMGVMRLDSAESYLADGTNLILKFTKDLVRACKPARNQVRWLVLRETTVDVVEIFDGVKEPKTLADVKPALSLPVEANGLYIDGTFPDWTRVMPSADSATLGQRYEEHGEKAKSWVGFNPDYIAAFANPAHKDALIVEYNGDSPALVTNGDERFLGVLMPMRVSFTNEDWAAKIKHITGAPERIREPEASEQIAAE